VTERKKAEDALRYRVEFERLIAAISTHFLALSPETVDDGINHALRLIGGFTGVDRSYIFRIYDDGTRMSNTHEWCSEGTEPHIQRLQALPVDAFPWLAEKLRKLEVMHIPRVAELPPEARAEKSEFELEKIRSLITVPMVYGKELRGFIGLDSVRAEKAWSGEDVRLLQMVGEIICNALERLGAEKARMETEHRYRTLFMESLEAMALTVEGRLVDVNPAWLRMLGFTDKNEVLGVDVINVVHPDDHNTLIAWRNMPDRDISRPEQLRNVRKDGSVLNVEVYSSEVLIEGKRAILTTVRDITERKRAEERVQQQVQRLAALHAIDIAITASLDLRATLNVFLGQAATILGAHAGAVLLINPHSQMLEYAAGHGLVSTAFSDARFRLGEEHPGQAALERRAIRIPNLQENPASERLRWLASEGFVTYHAVPLIAKGNVKGVLELFHRTAFSPDREWTDVLETLAVQGAIAIDNATLLDELQRLNAELVLAYDTTLEGWSRALDMRDETTEGHTQRVTELLLSLARKMGIGEAQIVHMRRGALLHDIGKMAIPDSILLKPGTLSKRQRVRIRQHPIYAYELLSPISFLRPALEIPVFHHENWNGTGYPRRLKGEQIPLAARIFAVVDAWDALRSRRPYREAWTDEKAREYIQEQAGKHFDPTVVKAFFEMLDEKR
jgi:PAS domain S-box-containing protein/putative nucleotidyltransferase with HDIG domain